MRKLLLTVLLLLGLVLSASAYVIEVMVEPSREETIDHPGTWVPAKLLLDPITMKFIEVPAHWDPEPYTEVIVHPPVYESVVIPGRAPVEINDLSEEEKVRIKEALAKKLERRAEALGIKNAAAAISSLVNSSIITNIGGTDLTTSGQNGVCVGDPVRIATGEFVTESLDLQLARLLVSRYYESGKEITGSLGRGWSFSHDRRLIMGVRPGAESEYEQLQLKLEEIELLLAASDPEEVERELSPLLERTEAVIRELEGAVFRIADSTYWSYPELKEAYRLAQAETERARQYRASLLELGRQAQGCHDEIKLARDELKLAVEAAGHEVKIARARRERNRYTLWPGTPESFRDTGNNRVTFIDSKGIPHLFYLTTDPDYYSKSIYPDGSINYYPQGSKSRQSLPGSLELELLPDGVYTIKDKRGTVLTFNYYGLLIKESDLNGNSLHYLYDPNFRLEQIRDDYERALTISRDSSDRVRAISDSAGRNIYYSYDNNGQLASVTDPIGDLITYNYSGGLLTGIGKPDGSGRSYRYSLIDGKMRVTGTSDEEGSTESFKYNTKERWTEYSNSAGIKERYHYNDRFLTTKLVHGDGTYVTGEYDSNNNLTKQTAENGGIFLYTYDSNHNLLSATDPEGITVSYSYNSDNRISSTTDGEGNVITYSYDAKGNLTAKLYPDGTKESFSYNPKGWLVSFRDGNNNLVTYVPDRYGRIEQVTDAEGNSTTYSYDLRGNLLSHTDPTGRTTGFSYNENNKLIKVTNPEGAAKEYHYNSRKDLIRIVDELGNLTTIDYDLRHNPVRVTDAEGNLTEYSYNMQGKVLTRTAGGTTISNSYDRRGRLTQVKEESTGATVNYSYTPTGQPGALTDALGHRTSYSYNRAGHLTTITNPLGEKRTIEYNRNYLPVKTTNEAGDITLYSYDNRNRITGKTLPTGARYSYIYDSAGNLTAETDPLGNKTSYSYNSNGQVVTITDPLKSITTYSYNKAGELATVTDPRGSKSVYHYNNLGKLSKATLPTGAEKLYSYDRAGNLKELTNYSGAKTTYNHDKLGRVLTVTNSLNQKTTYSYNSLGKIATVTNPLGQLTTLEYNPFGDLLKATNPRGETTTYTYDLAGNRTTVTNGEGETTTYSYDRLNRITQVTNPLGQTTGYNYDKRGNIKEEIINSKAYLYRYGPLGQLLKETNRAGRSQSYSYNLKGQLIGKTDFNGATTTYNYTVRGQLATVNYPDKTVKSMSYDELGNLIESTTPELKELYQYNSLNQPLRITTQHLKEDKVERIDYNYDPAGRRTTMIIDPLGRSEKVNYRYDALNRVTELRDNRNRVTKLSYDPLGRITTKQLPNGTATHYHYDPAGNISRLINRESTGKITQSFGYTYDRAGRKKYELRGDGKLTAYKYDPLGRVREVYYPFQDKANQAIDERYDSGLNFIEYPEGMPTIPDYEITWLNEKTYKQKTIPRVDYRELNKFPIVDERLAFSKEDTAELEELYPQILEHDNTQYSYSGSLKPHTRPFLREQFTFDTNSNITKVTNGWGSIDYKYDEANRLVQKGFINYSYDNNGNLLTEELAGEYSKSYKYNHDNRMSEAVEEKYKWQSKLKIGYSYDSMGRKRTARRVKLVNGATHEDRVEHYSYDGMNLIRDAHTILDSIGTILPHKEISYRHVGSKLLYSDEYSNMSKQYRNELYYHTNTTDTLTMATDAKGQEVEKYIFDIYGTVLKGEIDRANNIGYNSKRFNDATDGWQYEFREYLPGVKQFTTDDPIRSTTNWRTLTGGYNDPINYVDLLGLDPGAAKEVATSIANDPQSWAEALKIATTSLAISTVAAQSAGAAGVGAAAGAGAGGAAAAGGGGTALTVGLPVTVGIIVALVIGAGVLNAMYWHDVQEEQEELGIVPPENHPHKDVNSDSNIYMPSPEEAYRNFVNSADKPDVDKLNRQIQKETYGTDNNIGMTAEEALEDLTDPGMVAHDGAVANNGKKPRNFKHAGGQHPNTTVPFDNNGYPIFDSMYDASIPKDMYPASNSTHFKEATKQLKDAINAEPSLAEQFTKEQLEDIYDLEPKIDGVTWHHHQTPGKMQLVDEIIHSKTGHTGGRNIWGKKSCDK